ncbi:MAG: molybdopterin-dependent oxidoreductase [Ilumatobacteraceae bacterium]
MNTTQLTDPGADVPAEDEPASPEPRPARRPSRVFSLLAGLVVAGVALAVAELLAGLNRAWRSPVLDVGDRLIDAAPPFVKEFAIETFGTNDKPALLIGIGAFLAVYAAVVGLIALRHRFVVGVVGVALFGAIGSWASSSRRVSTPWHAVLPSVLGAAAGIGALWLIHESLRSQPTGEGPAVSAGATGRRQFLHHSGLVLGTLAIGAAVVGGLGRQLGKRFNAAGSRADVVLPPPVDRLPALPASVDVGVDGMTPFVTPNATFYRVDTALTAPQVPAEGYTLTIKGMVDKQIELSYEDLLDREMIERDITLTCVSNTVGGSYVGNARWLGTRLDTLLQEAGVQPGADQVVGRSIDGFECGFPVANAMDGRDAMIAVGMNGEPLPIEHGFPARLVVPGLYGFVSATKWLTEIELTTFADFDHYWLRRGWAQKAPIKLMSRIDTPRGLAKVAAGMVPIAGVAWAQTVGIAAVEVNIDGSGWQAAQLADAPSKDTWRQWVFPWNATSGRHSIAVRATDATGAIQTDERAEPIPDGASGHHQIVVIVE